MPRRTEAPFDPTGITPKGTPLGVSAPASDLAALMEAPPHAPEVWSRERLLPMRDVIEDAICAELDDREQFVFNALVVERKSLRDLGRDMSLSKTQVARVKQQAIEKLRTYLAPEVGPAIPMIKEYLER